MFAIMSPLWPASRPSIGRMELNLASLTTLSWSAPGVATPSDHIPTASCEPPDGGTHGAVALANATLMPVCGCALVVNYGMLAISALSVHRRRQSAPKSPTRLKPHPWLSKGRSHALSSPSTHTPNTNVPAHELSGGGDVLLKLRTPLGVGR